MQLQNLNVQIKRSNWVKGYLHSLKESAGSCCIWTSVGRNALKLQFSLKKVFTTTSFFSGS